jgi:Na+-transporting methylmalonyl-CoA/oxaloacetate decarboxylase gamma subunit
MNELMRDGLAITVVGMGMVFAGLLLLWGVVALLGRVFPEKTAGVAPTARTPAAEGARAGDAANPDGPLVVIVPLAGSSEATALRPVSATSAVAAAAGGPSRPAEETLTEERARVAALVAGALLSNALPMRFEVPTGPIFEHGRTAPLWVAANRARALPSWQPARRAEADRDANQFT